VINLKDRMPDAEEIPATQPNENIASKKLNQSI
jgi:hypothetical protein